MRPTTKAEEQGYDAENRRVWSQDRLGHRTFSVYDKVGRQCFTILPDDNDGVGGDAPSDSSDPRLADNPRTETVYDKAGRVLYEIDAVGAMTEYTYEDGCGCAMRRKEVIQHRAAPNANLVTAYQYDNAGHVRFVTDPRGNTVETQYDAQGRQTKVIYPATDEHPSTFTGTLYDPAGRRIAVIDQDGKITRYRYDGLGRLVEVRQYLDQTLAASDSAFSLQPSAAGVVSTRYTYDELGNQTTQTDARGNTTRYQYDAVSRRTQRILPDNAVETLQYDGWGNLWKRTDFRGYTTTFVYDSRNRLLEKQADPSHPSLAYSHAPDKITYGYDAMGNRTDATVEKGAMMLYAEATPFNERNWERYKETADGRLTYDHYANGQLKSIGSSNADGVHLSYRYDEINRLVYVDDTSGGPARTSGYTYNANGSLAMLSQPNGIGHAYGYDSLNRLRTLQIGRTVPGEPLIHSYTHSLRVSGHRRQVVESSIITPTRTTTYDYDGLYRLTGETVTGGMAGTNGVISYTLDKVGNRLNRTVAGELQPKLPSSTSSFNDRDWLNSDSYDTNGNTLTSLLNSVSIPDVYDFEDRLIVRHKPDGSTVNHSYDADGILHQKTVLSPGLLSVSTTSYLTDTQNLTGYAQVLEERTQTAGGTTVKTYAYGADLLSQSTLESSATLPVLRYYVYDGLGSVRGLTDESGSITDVYDYDAFGTLIYRSGTTDNDYLYRGERFDSDIGEYCLRARFYNQATGRFWNADTYEGDNADPVSLHRYLYANMNPVTFIDPSGKYSSLSELSMVSAIVGVLAGIAVPNIPGRTYEGGKFSERFTDCMASNGGPAAVIVLSVAFGVDLSIPAEFALDLKDPWEIARNLEPGPYTTEMSRRISALKQKLIREGMANSWKSRVLQGIRNSARIVTKVKTAAVLVGAAAAGYAIGLVPGCAIAASIE